ncbi:putative arylamine N-acetyltransferase [Rosellinia necatrix]|uniref:Putative arylamine N-acetyltransferase n=1 Tax=Rosellinia necatrix TaxID=77044 RepID=A0A1W2TE36_ROSNE|nr:putative arylamine N-acetyltransferase [Rosellinia necatrix]
MAMPSSAYTREQIDQFLDHIQLPEKYRHAPPSYELLKTLHTYMLAAVPYENLAIHYNPAHAVEIDPQHLFRKIVGGGRGRGRGRGGYCMENAILYNHVLVGLGFDAYTAGVRTRLREGGVPRGDFPGWVHIVSIVDIAGQRYHVDIAFGGDCATLPLPLVDGLVHRNLGAQQVRLVRDWIPTQLRRTEDAKLWIYQYRNGPDLEWNSFYCFPLVEFMPNDWEVVNVFASTSPRCWQVKTVIAIKFLRRPREREGSDGDGDGNGEGEEETYGKRMLVNDVIKENLGGRTSVIYECKDEADRVAALEKYFDIRLTDEEKNGIVGWPTALP